MLVNGLLVLRLLLMADILQNSSFGEERKFNDMWGDWNLSDFVESLKTGELPAGIRFLNGEDPNTIF